jgi:hypothetical protein
MLAGFSHRYGVGLVGSIGMMIDPVIKMQHNDML